MTSIAERVRSNGRIPERTFGNLIVPVPVIDLATDFVYPTLDSDSDSDSISSVNLNTSRDSLDIVDKAEWEWELEKQHYLSEPIPMARPASPEYYYKPIVFVDLATADDFVSFEL